MKEAKLKRVCSNGHQYYKSSDCPTCPICEKGRKPKEGFLSTLAAPARRALEQHGIISIDMLTSYSEKDLFQWHGMGKSGISTLRKLMSQQGLTFKDTQVNTKVRKKQHPSKPEMLATGAAPFVQTFFHGTKADLKIGDLIEIGFKSNFGSRKHSKYIFLSRTLDAAIWGAELANGKGDERIYLVEALGMLEDDPDLTNQKFPGNPTQSYRSKEPFKVVGEVTKWQGHAPEQLKAMKAALAKLKAQNISSLNE